MQTSFHSQLPPLPGFSAGVQAAGDVWLFLRLPRQAGQPVPVSFCTVILFNV